MHVSDVRKIVSGQCDRLHSNPLIKGIAIHSRDVREGWVFVAIPGTLTDGMQYADDAIRRGAVTVICERHFASRSVTVIRVADARLAAAQLAAAFNDYPARRLAVAGVTGTNGKTTVAMLLRAILRQAGMEPGLIGTVAYEIGSRIIASPRTTPDAITLQHLLHQMVTTHCQAAVLEVSSHALVQSRVAEIPFKTAAFTNLTHDHLDYHGSMEAYYEAKASLFRHMGASATAVINNDDAWGQRLSQEPLACTRMTFGLDMVNSDVVAESLMLSAEGSQFDIKSPWGTFTARVTLPGQHNVANALAAFCMGVAMGVDPVMATDAVASLGMVRGRLERIHGNVDFNVFVDYAHTDDALRNVLHALRPLTQGRLIIVFGCGGNRDRQKRAKMGQVAVEMADRIWVTTDNPRQEDPQMIIDDVLAGVGEAPVEVVMDRRDAIHAAIREARSGDTVLIAGKGHETYQEIGGICIPFNDVEVAKAALAAC